MSSTAAKALPVIVDRHAFAMTRCPVMRGIRYTPNPKRSLYNAVSAILPRSKRRLAQGLELRDLPGSIGRATREGVEQANIWCK